MIDLIVSFAFVVVLFSIIISASIIFINNDKFNWTLISTELCPNNPTHKIMTVLIGSKIKRFRGFEGYWENEDGVLCSRKESKKLKVLYNHDKHSRN